MNEDPQVAVVHSNACISETSRLLCALERALDQSRTLRSLARQRDQLHQLERLTGPSRKTRSLRHQISELERHFRVAGESANGP